MSANTNPIYTLVPVNTPSIWTASLTANTKSDGTGTIGTDMVKAFTADATNGSFINRLRFNPTASVASTATTATVLRVYLSSVASGATTNANTVLWGEFVLGAQTADQAAGATNSFEIPMGIALAPSQTVLFSMHHSAAANTAWQCMALGGNY
jgi:hypothetical protein